MVPSQVEVRCGASFKTFESLPDGVRLKYKVNDIVYEADTKYLIGSDGASSIIRKRFTPKNEAKKLESTFYV